MTPDEESELRRAWEYHKCADEILASRMNYGMVAQSMLLVSYMTMFLATGGIAWLPPFVQGIVASFGLWYSVRQSAMAQELTKRMEFLRKSYLVRLDPIYDKYLNIDPLPHGSYQLRLFPGLWTLWGAMLLIAGWLFVTTLCPAVSH